MVTQIVLHCMLKCIMKFILYDQNYQTLFFAPRWFSKNTTHFHLYTQIIHINISLLRWYFNVTPSYDKSIPKKMSVVFNFVKWLAKVGIKLVAPLLFFISFVLAKLELLVEKSLASKTATNGYYRKLNI